MPAPQHKPLRTLLPALLALTTTALPARAAEHIILRNGFDLQCTARETVDGRVRLYTGAGSYLEVAPEAIATIEPLAPEAVAPAHPAAPQSAPAFPGPPARAVAPDLRALAEHAGETHHIDADLLSSIIRAESGGNARAVSRAGARGLMQLMPATATAMGVADSFAPEQNVAGGAAYLDRLLTLYHDDIILAVAAYNAGPAAVARFHGVPPYPETRTYVARVVREFNRRKLAAR